MNTARIEWRSFTEKDGVCSVHMPSPMLCIVTSLTFACTVNCVFCDCILHCQFWIFHDRGSGEPVPWRQLWTQHWIHLLCVCQCSGVLRCCKHHNVRLCTWVPARHVGAVTVQESVYLVSSWLVWVHVAVFCLVNWGLIALATYAGEVRGFNRFWHPLWLCCSWMVCQGSEWLVRVISVMKTAKGCWNIRTSLDHYEGFLLYCKCITSWMCMCMRFTCVTEFIGSFHSGIYFRGWECLTRISAFWEFVWVSVVASLFQTGSLLGAIPVISTAMGDSRLCPPIWRPMTPVAVLKRKHFLVCYSMHQPLLVLLVTYCMWHGKLTSSHWFRVAMVGIGQTVDLIRCRQRRRFPSE